MTADDVTDAMAVAAWDAYSPEDSISDMRKAIAAAINASGCVLVPREPTEKMLIAARDWSHTRYGKPIGNDAATGCWGAMLAAAPQPGKEKGDE